MGVYANEPKEFCDQYCKLLMVARSRFWDSYVNAHSRHSQRREVLLRPKALSSHIQFSKSGSRAYDRQIAEKLKTKCLTSVSGPTPFRKA